MHVCERKQSHSVRFETKWSQVVAFEQPPYSIHIIVGIACVVEGDRCIGSGNALLEGSFKKPQASSTLLRLQEATQKPDRNFSSRSSRASSTLVAETTNGRISGGRLRCVLKKVNNRVVQTMFYWREFAVSVTFSRFFMCEWLPSAF